MSNAANDLRIDYVEFPAIDIALTKSLYSVVFGWKFEDYGPNYTSFSDGRLLEVSQRPRRASAPAR